MIILADGTGVRPEAITSVVATQTLSVSLGEPVRPCTVTRCGQVRFEVAFETDDVAIAERDRILAEIERARVGPNSAQIYDIRRCLDTALAQRPRVPADIEHYARALAALTGAS